MRRRRRLPDLIALPLTLDTREPDRAAVNAIDGFDDLPPSFRDLLNYAPVNMALPSATRPDEPPCRTLALVVARYGVDVVRRGLSDVLHSQSGSPDLQVQNTRRAVYPKPRQQS